MPEIKLWTPSHLSSYPTSTVRFKQDTNLPERIAQDLSHFVYEHKLTGRVFLRLTETDLNDIGVHPLWRATLFASSRGLRKRVLRRGSAQARSARPHLGLWSTVRPRRGREGSCAPRFCWTRTRHGCFNRAYCTASTGFDGAPVPRPSSRLGIGNETGEEIMSASDVWDIELMEEEAAQLLAETKAAAVSDADAVVPSLTPEPPVPDVAIVVEPKDDTPKLTIEQLLATETTNGKGAGAEAREFEADDENGSGTGEHLPVLAPILTSRPRRGNTIGRRIGASLPDLFRASSPEPLSTSAPATATQEEVAILPARVEDLEERLAAQLQLEIAHVQAELARHERETLGSACKPLATADSSYWRV